MINNVLYKREMKGSIKLLIIFLAIITMYVSMIISMFDPKMMQMLDGFAKAMPEIMAAVGMNSEATSLIGFMISYLYGFILLVFPMVYSILRGNGLVAKYADKGSLVSLMAAPVKRTTIVVTQMLTMISGVLIMIVYTTILEYAVAQSCFKDELVLSELLKINGGLICLQLFLASVCFLASCLFSDTKYSIGVGAGVPAFMYVMNMLGNVGGNAEFAKYFTAFTLYDPQGLIDGSGKALAGVIVLLIGAIVFFITSVIVFDKKDLYI